MSVKLIILVRNIFLLAGFFTLFIGGQIIVNSGGEVYSFWEAFLFANILFTFQYWLYSANTYSRLVDEGMPIGYMAYQVLGMFTAAVALWIVSSAIYNSYQLMK